MTTSIDPSVFIALGELHLRAVLLNIGTRTFSIPTVAKTARVDDDVCDRALGGLCRRGDVLRTGDRYGLTHRGLTRWVREHPEALNTVREAFDEHRRSRPGAAEPRPDERHDIPPGSS